eukprot:4737811-Pyramimonas_sp.AAC.1
MAKYSGDRPASAWKKTTTMTNPPRTPRRTGHCHAPCHQRRRRHRGRPSDHHALGHQDGDATLRARTLPWDGRFPHAVVACVQS